MGLYLRKRRSKVKKECLSIKKTKFQKTKFQNNSKRSRNNQEKPAQNLKEYLERNRSRK